MDTSRTPRRFHRTSIRVATAVLVAAAATVVAVSLAAARPWSERPSEIPLTAVKPGSEKERILRRDQAQPTRAAPSPQGRPTEAWSPDVEPSIDDSGESPYPQRRDLLIVNAWHGGVAADGTITSVYAGMEARKPLLIVVRADLLTGEEVFHREIALPGGVVEPRIAEVEDSTVRVDALSGERFILDLDALTLTQT
jgi:hypothetical protein